MKNYILSIGLSAAALFAVGVPATAYAAPATQSDDATPHAVGEILTGSNRLKYKVTSVGETNEVAVTYNDVKNNYQCNAGWYMGDFVIPEKVTFDGVEYTVTAITDHAFYDAPYLTSIVMPETIRSIGEYAFWYCIELKTIDIPAAVEAIPAYCFDQCKELATVTGMENVKSLGNSAFSECFALKTLEGLTKVESIGEFAFSEDAQLLDLQAMPALKTIGRSAFAVCNSLTRVLLPSTVESLGEMFGNSLTADVKVYYCKPTPIELDSKYTFSTAAASENKFAPVYVPFGSASAFKYGWGWSSCDIRELTPNLNLTDAVSETAEGVTISTTVALGEGVKEENVPALFLAANDFSAYPAAVVPTLMLQYRAVGSENYGADFATADGVTASVTVKTLAAGEYEYRWISSLNNQLVAVSPWTQFTVVGVTEPEFEIGQVLTIDNVKYKITALGDNNEVAVTYNDANNDFKHNNEYYKGAYTIPATVTEGNTTFSVTSVDDHAFYNSYSLTSVVLPESVSSIGSYAFYGCLSLTTANIPAAVETVPDECFDKCSALLSVTGMANVKTLGNSAFMSCSALTTLEGLSKVETIDEFAFSSDAALTKLPEMPALKSIGRNAFSGCNSLAYLLLPATVESIGEILGSNITSGLKVYNCNTTPVEPSSLYSFCISTSPRAYAPIYVPYGYASTYSKAFIWKYSEIRELTPNVTVADGTAVSKNDAVSFSAAVALGEGVKEENVPALFLAANDFTAYPAAYAAGMKVEYRTVGSETSEFAAATFDNGNVTASVNGLSAGDYEYRWVYTSGEDNTEAVTDWKTVAVEGQKYALNQGLTIDGIKYRITALGETNEVAVTYNNTTNDYSSFVLGNVSNSSFYKNAEYVVPSTVTDDGTEFQVTSVDDYAFYQCKSTVTSIKLSEGIRTVGYRAFSYNQKITSIVLSETVKSIGDFAFDYCIALTTFDIPASVETIGEKSFSRCKKIETITGMEGVKTIGSSAFIKCTALNSIESLSSVETIGEFAFSDNTALATLPEMPALQTVGTSAFASCTALEYVVLPAAVNRVAELFSSSASADVKVYYCGNEPFELAGQYSFCIAKSPRAYAPIYVPCGTADAFRAATHWSNSEIRELTPNVDIVDCDVTPSAGNATFTADVVLGQGIQEENVPALFLAANDFTSYPAAYAAGLKVEYRLYGTEDSTIATGTAEGNKANAIATDLVAGNYEYRWVIMDGEEIIPVTEWDSFVNTETGIDGIDADTDAPVYYNLQGVRVVNPTAGIYLERKGDTMRKVVIK